MNVGVQVKGLKYGRRGWVLVMERLVRVDNDYYRPRRTLVEGEEAIVDAVAECAGRELAESARRAMANAQGEFRVQGNRFERRAVELARSQRCAKPSNDSSLDGLRTRCERLEQRVRALEEQLKSLAARGVDPHASGPSPSVPAESSAGPARDEPRPPRSDRDDSLEPDAPRRAAPDSLEPGSDGASDPDRGSGADLGLDEGSSADLASDLPEEPGAQQEERVADPEEPFPEPKAALRFPNLKDLASAAGEVMGESVEFSAAPSSEMDDGAWWVADLMADEESPLGALAVDRRALIRLGGTLMMMEPAAIEAMDDESPNPDLVDAMNEILKAQVRGFNHVKGNPHVHMSRLREFEPARDAWVAAAPNRLAFVDHFGGRWRVVSRALS